MGFLTLFLHRTSPPLFPAQSSSLLFLTGPGTDSHGKPEPSPCRRSVKLPVDQGPAEAGERLDWTSGRPGTESLSPASWTRVRH